ncbi:MAG: PBP1A family penicillin-binding protein [Pseudomonadota bacterium]
MVKPPKDRKPSGRASARQRDGDAAARAVGQGRLAAPPTQKRAGPQKSRATASERDRNAGPARAVAGGFGASMAHLAREFGEDLKAGVKSFRPAQRQSRPASAQPKTPPPAKKLSRRPANAAPRYKSKAAEAATRPTTKTTPAANAAPAVSAKPPQPADARRRRRGRSSRRAHLVRSAFLNAASLSFIAAGAALYILFIEIAPEPPDTTDFWAINRLPSVVMLDRNGEEIAARGARYGEAIAVNDLPEHFIQAFLATEDRRFFEHHGVDLRGVARAAVTNVRAGTIAEGGSTITQQLAKNLFLSPEQSYLRKAKEAMLAMWIEGRYEKEEILSLYLNRIYMGAGAFGVESAAQTYFGKSARDVTLSEAVMLAGLPKAPSALSPTSNPFGAQDRALEVLDNMKEVGAIDEAAAREARLNPPRVVSNEANGELGYFFDMVAERARTLAPPGQKDLVIQTTIDLDLQRKAEAALKSALTTDAKLAGATQGAIVVFDNKTGAMRAMVGGRSYVESQFNRATQARRQPGSAFKPFVYAAAFENGMTPSTRMVDQPIDIAGWRPKNYANRYDGPMRLTEAMARSVNTVAVQVSEEIGREKVIEMAERLGVGADIPEEEAGVALGAFNLTLEDLTAAYIPFARGGLGVSPHAIVRVADKDGRELFFHDPGDTERLVSREIARDMTHLLYQVMAYGTGSRARLPGGRQAVGKTGTTNDWRDAWFVGYTGQLTTGVWIGNDDYQPMNKITGGALPAIVWRDFMAAAHKGWRNARLEGAYPAENFADEEEMQRFYFTVEQDLLRVARGRRARSRSGFLGEPDYRERR